MLLLALILIFIISIASTWWFGLWSNLITLVNLILAGLIATSFFENFAYELMIRAKSYRLVLLYVSLWLTFVISFFVLRAATDGLSGMRLKFDTITEMVGRSLLSLAIAGVLVSFISFTLQLAPLRPSLFSSEREAGGTPLGPDKLWHGFVQQCSAGSLSYTSAETQFFPEYKAVRFDKDGVELEKLEVRLFDPTDSYFMAGAGLRQAISRLKQLRLPDQPLQ